MPNPETPTIETIDKVKIESLKVFTNPQLQHVRIEVRDGYISKIRADVGLMNPAEIKMFSRLITAALGDSQDGD